MDDSMENQLMKLRKELAFVKKNMVLRDEVVTIDEFESYKRSFDKKNLVSFKDAKKELGLQDDV